MQPRRAGDCLTVQQARPAPSTLRMRLLRLASRRMPVAHCWRRRCCLHHPHCQTLRLSLRSRPGSTHCRPRCHHLRLRSHQPRACPRRLRLRLERPSQARPVGQHRLFTSHPLHRPRRLSPRRPCHQRRHRLLGHRHHRHRMRPIPRRPRRQRRRYLRFRRLCRPRKCCLTHRAPRRPRQSYRYHQAQLFRRRSCHFQRVRGRPWLRPSSQEVEPT